MTEHEDFLRAELLRVDQLTLGALRLGFRDDVRHWRAIRSDIVRKLREMGAM